MNDQKVTLAEHAPPEIENDVHKSSATSSNKQTTQENINLALTIHQHIHDNIKFADQKALFLTVLNTALLGYIWSLTAVVHTPLFYTKLFVCGALALAIGFAVWTVRPRGDRPTNSTPGLVNPNRIVMHKKFTDYQTELNAASKNDVLIHLQELIYDRSNTNQKKYDSLRISLNISALGWIGGLGIVVWPTLSALSTHLTTQTIQ
ncbi:Pycsar system effector family protein [Poriferisphaera sp. WC338]|uniref:Pycsar system effector family protein n=1 Tax=Poriferisphaera sp. WC338 TaxID=3425129 RepID=UPI003D815FF2